MRIIAYTYEAGVHCIACTQKRAHGTLEIGLGFRFHPDSLNSPDHEAVDEHGISIHAVDREGNPIHPIFSTDEQLEPIYCGDCHERIGQ